MVVEWACLARGDERGKEWTQQARHVVSPLTHKSATGTPLSPHPRDRPVLLRNTGIGFPDSALSSSPIMNARDLSVSGVTVPNGTAAVCRAPLRPDHSPSPTGWECPPSHPRQNSSLSGYLLGPICRHGSLLAQRAPREALRFLRLFTADLCAWRSACVRQRRLLAMATLPVLVWVLASAEASMDEIEDLAPSRWFKLDSKWCFFFGSSILPRNG